MTVNPRTNRARRIANAARMGGKPSAQQASLRHHNLALVLDTIAQSSEPPSRAAISELTGLTKATVSALVDQLIVAKLINELDPVPSAKAGRPAIPLTMARGTYAGIGLEISVDYLGLKAVDLSGAMLTERIEFINLRGSDSSTVLAHLAELTHACVRELKEHGLRIAGASMALPGLVDAPLGPLRRAPNLGWRDVDVLTEFMTQDPGVELLRIENESVLGARAQLVLQDTEAPDSFIYLSGQIGIGSALVIHGAIAEGLHGWAGEIGHVVVEPNGMPCSCGSRGCLEAYAGKNALIRGAGLRSEAGAADLLAAIDSGSPEAIATMRTAGLALGTALASFMNLVDISDVVLAGDYALLYPLLSRTILDCLRSQVLSAPWLTDGPNIRPAATRDYPSLTGAALRSLTPLMSDPASWLETDSR